MRSIASGPPTAEADQAARRRFYFRAYAALLRGMGPRGRLRFDQGPSTEKILSVPSVLCSPIALTPAIDAEL